MTTVATPEHPVSGHHLRPWAALLIAPFGDGVRRRSATDLVKLLLSVIGLFIMGLLTARSNHVQEAISNALHPPPQGISWLVRAMWVAGSFGVALLVLAVVAVARRLEVLRDVASSVILAYLACLGIQTVFGVSAGFHPDPNFHNVNVGFPVPFLAIGTAAAFTILSLIHI